MNTDLKKICDITEKICRGYFSEKNFDEISQYFTENTRKIGTEQDEYFRVTKNLFKGIVVLSQMESEAYKIANDIYQVKCEFMVKSNRNCAGSQGTRISVSSLFAIAGEEIALCEFVFCISPRQLRKQIENREHRLIQELRNVICYQKALEIENEAVFEINAEKTEVKGNFASFLKVEDNLTYNLPMLVELVGKDIHKDDRSNVDAWWKRFYTSGYPYQTELLEYRYHPDGTDNYAWHRVLITPITNENGKLINFIGRIKDIDDRKKHEQAMRNLSCEDSLTGLLNRRYTELAIDQYIAIEGGYGALLMLDLDNFKAVNDTLGHYEGDQTLIEVAQVLRGVCGKKDIIGRIGGDEFIVFLRKTVNKQVIYDKAEQIVNALDQRSRDKAVKTTATIGISVAPYDGETFTVLWTNADSALYRVKRNGKNGFGFFDENYVIGK